MKIGIFTALFHDMPIEQALDIIAGAGIKAVEFGGGEGGSCRTAGRRGHGTAEHPAADAVQPVLGGRRVPLELHRCQSPAAVDPRPWS